MTGRPHLETSLSTPDGKSRYVRRLFATIADRYDPITVLLRGATPRGNGVSSRWRVCAGHEGARPRLRNGHRVRAGIEGAHVAGLDITPRMVELAKRAGRHHAWCRPFFVGDMLALPFPDRAFDLVTTEDGIRNVPDIDAALSEVRRVLRPEGCSCRSTSIARRTRWSGPSTSVT